MLFTRGTFIEISVFVAIVWYTYHDKRLMNFLALAGAIITQASIYFPVIIEIQIYLRSP